MNHKVVLTSLLAYFHSIHADPRLNYRHPICYFPDDQITDAVQDWYNEEINFQTDGQPWINVGPRRWGTVIEPVSGPNGETGARIEIVRRGNEENHLFYIVLMEISIYQNHCQLQHYNHPGIIGEIVFMTNMKNGLSSKDIVVPIARGKKTDKIFKTLKKSKKDDRIELDLSKLNVNQCHFAIHPNRYRMVLSPNNAFTIKQKDIDRLAILEGTDCSKVKSPRDARCDIYKNGAKKCKVGKAKYILANPEQN